MSFFLLSPPSPCSWVAFSLPSGEYNLGHSSVNASGTLAAATGVGITKVLKKPREKKKFMHSRHK